MERGIPHRKSEAAERQGAKHIWGPQGAAELGEACRIGSENEHPGVGSAAAWLEQNPPPFLGPGGKKALPMTGAAPPPPCHGAIHLLASRMFWGCNGRAPAILLPPSQRYLPLTPQGRASGHRRTWWLWVIMMIQLSGGGQNTPCFSKTQQEKTKGKILYFKSESS